MPTPPSPSLPAQGLRFVLVGCVQLLLDWAVFVATTAAGVPVVLANPLARAAGACLGFWLNGRYTFARDGQPRLGWHRFARFLPSWLLLTLLSTVAIAWISQALGLETAWLAKPAVEALSAVLGFVVWRHWVYR